MISIPYYTNHIIPFNLDPKGLPTHLEFFLEICFFMLIEDFLFYWSHRFQHLDWVYPFMHKIHHTYKTSISLAAEYMHPLEFSMSVICTAGGSMILGKRVHLVTYLLWIIIRVTESADGHCGYDFSFSPFRIVPCSGSSEFHFFHHKFFKGNYSTFFIHWDRLFNTVNPSYIDFYNAKQNINKQSKIN